jgi:hypothetical protein
MCHCRETTITSNSLEAQMPNDTHRHRYGQSSESLESPCAKETTKSKGTTWFRYI